MPDLWRETRQLTRRGRCGNGMRRGAGIARKWSYSPLLAVQPHNFCIGRGGLILERSEIRASERFISLASIEAPLSSLQCSAHEAVEGWRAG